MWGEPELHQWLHHDSITCAQGRIEPPEAQYALDAHMHEVRYMYTIPLPTSIGGELEADGEQFVQAMVTEGLIIICNIEKSVR